MPRADNLPPITLIDCGVPSPANPLGAKGAGEAGATGAVPALANAVLDALKAGECGQARDAVHAAPGLARHSRCEWRCGIPARLMWYCAEEGRGGRSFAGLVHRDGSD